MLGTELVRISDELLNQWFQNFITDWTAAYSIHSAGSALQGSVHRLCLCVSSVIDVTLPVHVTLPAGRINCD